MHSRGCIESNRLPTCPPGCTGTEILQGHLATRDGSAVSSLHTQSSRLLAPSPLGSGFRFGSGRSGFGLLLGLGLGLLRLGQTSLVKQL